MNCKLCGTPVKVVGKSTLRYELDKHAIAKEIIERLPPKKISWDESTDNQYAGYNLGIEACRDAIGEWGSNENRKD